MLITDYSINHLSRHDIIPVAMGARKTEYEKVAPPHSFIHVDDFNSPEQLAEYLHLLDQNDELYNEYFRWKGTGEMIDTKFPCRLCAMVNIGKDYPMWYDTLQQWWQGNDTCITGNHTWASWRDHPVINDVSHRYVRYGYDRSR